MVNFTAALPILGLVLSILALVISAYLLFERIFGSLLFTVFWRLAPVFIQAFYPRDPTTVWFAVRANRNIYNNWDTALILLLANSWLD